MVRLKTPKVLDEDTIRAVFDPIYTISGLGDAIAKGSHAHVQAGDKKFEVIVRIDTPQEIEYYRNGGILPYVLRQLAN